MYLPPPSEASLLFAFDLAVTVAHQEQVLAKESGLQALLTAFRDGCAVPTRSCCPVAERIGLATQRTVLRACLNVLGVRATQAGVGGAGTSPSSQRPPRCNWMGLWRRSV